jgi:putative addiction module component (TIGR02574 family)
MSFEVKEILALPDKEKKRIADLIYESLQNEVDSNIANEPLPEWQKEILDERIKSIDDGTAKFLSKEEFNKRVKEMMDEKRNRIS